MWQLLDGFHCRRLLQTFKNSRLHLSSSLVAAEMREVELVRISLHRKAPATAALAILR